MEGTNGPRTIAVVAKQQRFSFVTNLDVSAGKTEK